MSIAVLRLISFILGIILITLAVSMLIPMLTLVIHDRKDDMSAFLWSSLITALCGLVMINKGRPENVQLRPRDMYMLTTASWVVVCIFAALPMVLIQHISYSDAFFETMSGITTTGSTILTGLDTASPGLLIWRSMLHWLGGIGFIGMAVAILPLLRVGACGYSRPNRPTGRKRSRRAPMSPPSIFWGFMSGLPVLLRWPCG